MASNKKLVVGVDNFKQSGELTLQQLKDASKAQGGRVAQIIRDPATGKLVQIAMLFPPTVSQGAIDALAANPGASTSKTYPYEAENDSWEAVVADTLLSTLGWSGGNLSKVTAASALAGTKGAELLPEQGTFGNTQKVFTASASVVSFSTKVKLINEPTEAGVNCGVFFANGSEFGLTFNRATGNKELYYYNTSGQLQHVASGTYALNTQYDLLVELSNGSATASINGTVVFSGAVGMADNPAIANFVHNTMYMDDMVVTEVAA